jgi:murein L,D-transpeptidase YcbB/YkuD
MNYLIGIAIILIINAANGKGSFFDYDRQVIQASTSSLSIDSLLVLQHHDPVLESFYRQNNFNLFWSSAEARATAILALSDAAAEGLDPADYNADSLKIFENQYEMLSADKRATYDILLTISLQKYISHIANGKLDPNELYNDWILPRETIDVNQFLLENAHSPAFATAIDNLKPQHFLYGNLKNALKLIDQIPAVADLDSIRITKKIVLNEMRDVVPLIKARLMQWRDLKEHADVTAVYDMETVEAVKKFQRRNGLRQDGVIGPATADALNVSLDSRRKSIVASLERWRWYPRDLGDHYIIINIPAFRMAIVKDGDTIETKKVIVGTSDRRTPILTSMFSNITFNPTWTVPPTILREDIVTSAIKDRAYFYEKRITIYDGNNNVISPWRWKSEKATAYRYVQSPGDHNALGTVKFNFPNDRMVYLHDTNTRAFFSQHYRSLSSGCVRVENPMPFAEYLLNDPGWPLEKLEKIIASRKTTTIKIKDRIKLHQLYWTAWTETDGTLIFREDIYKLDEELYAKLRS